MGILEEATTTSGEKLRILLPTSLLQKENRMLYKMSLQQTDDPAMPHTQTRADPTGCCSSWTNLSTEVSCRR